MDDVWQGNLSSINKELLQKLNAEMWNKESDVVQLNGVYEEMIRLQATWL